jgi:GNAT superfamily N-acetyltransferase
MSLYQTLYESYLRVAPPGWIANVNVPKLKDQNEIFGFRMEISFAFLYETRKSVQEKLPRIKFFYFSDRSIVSCVDLYVPLQFRGRGIGKLLVKGMERFACEMGCNTSWAISSNNSFWNHRGYNTDLVPAEKRLI